ncbi:response regulator transcription factor [Actinoplanes sp. NPDC026619]|uniref:response regulator transcription factor n=1 Tax=Actinoplanes sp. NPDC026619 TaxID=3155798 RepID=UPI0033D3071A
MRHRLLAAGLRDELVDPLQSSGYLVEAVATGADAMVALGQQPVDLVIVDSDLPDLQEIAHRRPVLHRPPVLCVASCESLGRLVPELGTDIEDYVTKPCRVAELLARVEVLLRERARGDLLRRGDLLLDEKACRVWRGGRRIEVTAAEFRLLRHLLVNAGRVLTKEQLAWHVWNEPREVNAIERLISRLRQKIDEAGPPLIHTRRGFGYSMV